METVFICGQEEISDGRMFRVSDRLVLLTNKIK
jgi:hypothetical protein